jgi:hypothetical protein
MVFRWEKVATKSFDDGVTVFEKDRWTGQLFISQYGNPDIHIFHRYPESAYDYSKMKWTSEDGAKLTRGRKIMAAAWWVLLAASAAWLLVEFYRPRHQAPPGT